MFVALGIKHEMRMRRIVICGLSSRKIFFHIISQEIGFSKENFIVHKMPVKIFFFIKYESL
jgi:hypothetical protein